MVNYTKYNLIMIIHPMKSVKIISASNPTLEISAGLCETFQSRFLGFMFRKSPGQNYGLFFPGSSDSRINTAIHMFFVNFRLAVYWLDKNNVVVDKAMAERWRPLYMPCKPARHILELHENRIDAFAIGDRLNVTYVE